MQFCLWIRLEGAASLRSEKDERRINREKLSFQFDFLQILFRES